MKLIILILSFSIISANAGLAGDLKEYDDTHLFPFIKNGHLLNYGPQSLGQLSHAMVTVYKPQKGGEIILSGSPMGLEKMLQNEFPQGVDGDFVHMNLIKLLDECLSSNGTEMIMTDRVLSNLRDNVKIKAQLLDFMHPPALYCRENHWAVRLMVGDGNGGITLKVFKGLLRPFEISSATEFLLWPSTDRFNAQKASLLQEKADVLYNEN